MLVHSLCKAQFITLKASHSSWLGKKWFTSLLTSRCDNTENILILSGLDDEGLAILKAGRKLMRTLNWWKCHSISHISFTSLTNDAQTLEKSLSYHTVGLSPLTLWFTYKFSASTMLD
ncbi:hypothetical protein VNO77_41924 [Canavalia gladiata]|uniref:Uncharacterized protein n=1 Tax=Canavalia gladiata TaxID=3824 RepID=A0AAN9K037_CANGL